MARLPKSVWQSFFDERSGAMFDGMRSRAGKQGREVPFDRSGFRKWALEQFGSVDAAVQCAYCQGGVTVADFVVDHQTPIAAPWHGSLALENLAVCCASCNRRKGRMSAAGFRLLVAWGTAELDQRDFADVLGRLANGAAGLRLRRAVGSVRRAA